MNTISVWPHKRSTSVTPENVDTRKDMDQGMSIHSFAKPHTLWCWVWVVYSNMTTGVSCGSPKSRLLWVPVSIDSRLCCKPSPIEDIIQLSVLIWGYIRSIWHKSSFKVLKTSSWSLIHWTSFNSTLRERGRFLLVWCWFTFSNNERHHKSNYDLTKPLSRMIHSGSHQYLLREPF